MIPIDEKVLKISPTNFRTKIKTSTGVVIGSLIASIQQKVKDQKIAYRFMDAYLYDYNLRRELKRGAKFSITYEEKYDGKSFIRTGEVLASSLEIRDQIQYRHLPEGSRRICRGSDCL